MEEEYAVLKEFETEKPEKNSSPDKECRDSRSLETHKLLPEKPIASGETDEVAVSSEGPDLIYSKTDAVFRLLSDVARLMAEKQLTTIREQEKKRLPKKLKLDLENKWPKSYDVPGPSTESSLKTDSSSESLEVDEAFNILVGNFKAGIDKEAQPFRAQLRELQEKASRLEMENKILRESVLGRKANQDI